MQCIGDVIPEQFPGPQSPQTTPFSSPLDTRKKLSCPPPPRLDESAAEAGPWAEAGWQGERSEGAVGVVPGLGSVLIDLFPPRNSRPDSRQRHGQCGRWQRVSVPGLSHFQPRWGQDLALTRSLPITLL